MISNCKIWLKMQLQWSVCLLLSLVVGIQCYSTGAPASACSDIYPVGHLGTSQDLSTNPFQLSLSDFDQTYGGEIYYVPGQDYTCESPPALPQSVRGWMYGMCCSDSVRIRRWAVQRISSTGQSCGRWFSSWYLHWQWRWPDTQLLQPSRGIASCQPIHAVSY